MEERNDNGQTQASGKDCLSNLLPDSTTEAKQAEFKKETEKKLGDLVKNVDKEEDAYRDALDEFKEKWNKLDHKIRKLRKHFEDCYDHRCFIEKVICNKVILPEWDLRKELLNEKLCGSYKELFLVSEDLVESKNQLDAWEKITKWLNDRLVKNAKLYEEICKLDNCKDRYFAIYILYFDLIPAHEAMDPKLEDPIIIDPAKIHCKKQCGGAPQKGSAQLRGYPYLIDPDEYNCELSEIWKTWKKAGLAQVKAQCDVDQIEKCREQYKDLATSEARRSTAREAFQRFDERCCKKNSEDSNDKD